MNAGQAAQIQMASKPVPGSTPPSEYSQHRAISADGRFVAFISGKTLVPGQTDANGEDPDVFLYDGETGTNILVSRSATSPSTTGNGGSSNPALSADGRYVAFSSKATNLVPGQVDSNQGEDVFLYDRVTGTTTLLSHASGSTATAANHRSDYPRVSADGGFVAFHSYADNLVAGVSDPLGGSHDVFLYDRTAGTTILVSRSAASSSATGNHHSIFPSLSADGRFVLFTSYATNLVAGQNDVNDNYDIFLFDRIGGTMTLVSRASGSPATTANDGSTLPSMNADGGYVVFRSLATNLVLSQGSSTFYNIFLFERATGVMRLVSGRGGSPTQPAGYSGVSSLSADGRFVAFESGAPDLVPGQVDRNSGSAPNFDIFFFDRITGTITLASHSFTSPVATGDWGCWDPVISANGRFAAARCYARDLVPGFPPDYLGDGNTFLFDRLTGVTRLVTRSLQGYPISGSQGIPAISEDGSALAFTSRGRLSEDDLDWNEDVYLWTDPQAGRGFYTLPACRLFDSRTPSDGAAPLVSGSPLVLSGTYLQLCDIPETAVSLAVNVTVTQPTGAGHLILHPGDSSAPQSSTINFSAGQTRSNNAMLTLAPGGALTISPYVAGNGSVHVIVDVAGYFE